MVGVWRGLRSRVSVSAESDGERGAVLAFVAIFLTVLVMVAALALDLSALERRAQTLQNTADAASLAGVATWERTGSMAQAELTALDIIRQNGLVESDVTASVTFPTDNRIQVTLVDAEPDVFLGSFMGMGGALERGAQAKLVRCDPGCNRSVELPAPFQPTSVVGSGDGYYPVAVGNRFYAINHDGDEIACVDRATSSQCWRGKLALPYSGATAGPVSHTVVVGTRIYWSAQHDTGLSMFCWETRTEESCGATLLAGLARAPLGEKFQQRGGGVAAVGARVFAFTDDHRVRCLVAPSMTECPGYGGGRMTGLGQLGFVPLDPALGVSGSNIDRVIHPDGRIYHTLQIASTTASDAAYDTGIWLDCWDTSIDMPCGGFSPSKIHDVAQRQAGRLFFYRTSAGTPAGVCSTGAGDLACTDLAGNPDPSLESTLASLESALPAATTYTNGMGIHTYHPESNRLFLTSPRQLSTVHCWDFDTSSYCGSRYGFANGAETQDYGFAVEGDCLFGVGHTSVFWAITSDMSAGCPGATVETQIDKCICGSQARWGRVDFDFDLGDSSVFAVLNAQVLSPEGDVLYPTDGGWVQLKGRASTSLDLDVIPTNHDYLRLRVYAETNGTDPWLAPAKPSVLFDFTDSPQLIE